MKLQTGTTILSLPLLIGLSKHSNPSVLSQLIGILIALRRSNMLLWPWRHVTGIQLETVAHCSHTFLPLHVANIACSCNNFACGKQTSIVIVPNSKPKNYIMKVADPSSFSSAIGRPSS